MVMPVDLFTKDQFDNYVVVDRDEVEKQTRARSLALMSAALIEWVTYINGRFARPSTVSRYMESLYIDTTNPFNIKIGVEGGTLASVLEYGQSAFQMINRNSGESTTSSTTAKTSGPRNKIRPIDAHGIRPYVSDSNRPPAINPINLIPELDSGSDPDEISSRVNGALSSFSRKNIAAKNFKPAGMFLPTKGTVEYRVMKPSDTWRHKGVDESKRAMAGEFVTTWIRDHREEFTKGMFEGEVLYEW